MDFFGIEGKELIPINFESYDFDLAAAVTEPGSALLREECHCRFLKGCLVSSPDR